MTAAAHAADRTRDLAGVAAAHRRLLAVVDRLDDDAARGPSLLPGWSVGHVLTHIARNADANAGVLAAAELGDVVPMYPSMEARNADIEAGSSRRAADLVDDVRSSAARFEQQAAATSEVGWSGSGSAAFGPLPAGDVPWRRWREVEVHTADLGLDAGPAAWPAEFVRLELVRMQMLWASRRPMGLTDLPAEALAAAPHQRLAWLFGRAGIDGLDPAGIF